MCSTVRNDKNEKGLIKAQAIVHVSALHITL